MDALVNWITHNPTGFEFARISLMVLGVLIWGTLFTIAATSKRGRVPWHLAIFIVVGSMAGIAAAHAGFYGQLASGAVAAVLACLSNLGVLVSVVGSPAKVTEKIEKMKEPWLSGIVAYGTDLNDMVKDWPEIHDKPQKQKEKV